MVVGVGAAEEVDDEEVEVTCVDELVVELVDGVTVAAVGVNEIVDELVDEDDNGADKVVDDVVSIELEDVLEEVGVVEELSEVEVDDEVLGADFDKLDVSRLDVDTLAVLEVDEDVETLEVLDVVVEKSLVVNTLDVVVDEELLEEEPPYTKVELDVPRYLAPQTEGLFPAGTTVPFK
jgi:hypothetical protein